MPKTMTFLWRHYGWWRANFHLITSPGILYLNSHYDHGINDTFHTSPLDPHFSPVTQDLSPLVTFYLPLVHFLYLLSMTILVTIYP